MENSTQDGPYERESVADTPGTKLLKVTEQSEMVDVILYQSAVGRLLFGWTRPILLLLSVMLPGSMREHWMAIKRILRYLKGTTSYGPEYSASLEQALL